MKKLILTIVLCLIVSAQTVKADEPIWTDMGDTAYKNHEAFHATKEIILPSGLECHITITYYKGYLGRWIYGYSSGQSCNYQLYNCLYHGLCGGGSQNGASVNINRK
jgi:outer membrane lipoprotein-sorting protein